MRSLMLLLFCLIATTSAGAHEGHDGPVRPVTPPSERYLLVIPSTWYDSPRFNALPAATSDRLYIAETETIFEAWRDGTVLGPILQVTTAPVPDDGPTHADAILAAAVEALRGQGSEPAAATVGGFPALRVSGFPYRDAFRAGITFVYVEPAKMLFQFFYAADRDLHFHEAEELVQSFALVGPVDETALADITTLAESAPGASAEIGMPAPPFSLSAYGSDDGETLALADYRGRTVLLSFWATWCIPCRRELPLMQQAVAGRDDVAVIAVNYREAPGVIRQFVTEWRVDLPIALDRAGYVADLYEIAAYPTNIIIDGGGVIRLKPQFTPETTIADIQSWLDEAA